MAGRRAKQVLCVVYDWRVVSRMGYYCILRENGECWMPNWMLDVM